MKIINWELMSHPMNWLILFLMVFIPVVAIHVIAGGPPPSPSPTQGGK
jgi:hypothetical protein